MTTRLTRASAALATTDDFSTPSRASTSTEKVPIVTEPQRKQVKEPTSKSGASGDDMEVTPPTQQQQEQQHSTVTPPESATREPMAESRSTLVVEKTLENTAVNSPKVDGTTDSNNNYNNSKKGSLLIESQLGGKHVRFGNEDAVNMKVEEESIATTSTPTAAIANLSIKVEEGTSTVSESQETASLTPAAPDNSNLTNNNSNPASTATSQRGLVSRRGGRMGSPSKPLAVSVKSEPVVEYKTYRSPSRKRDENDTVPSLCSASSGGLTSASSLSTDKKPENLTRTAKGEPMEDNDTDHNDDTTEHRRPSSISCDPSMIDTTSPLASHEEVRPTPEASNAANNSSHNQLEASEDVMDSDDDARKQQPPQPKVALSPPPPRVGESNVLLEKKKTPTRSKFHTLPSLDDSKLNSPGAIFLSPHPPTPKPAIREVSSFDKCYDGIMKPDDDDDDEEVNEKRDEEEKSSKAREHDRERFVATPTDFAIDYGRGLQKTGSFDASNVLAWLQSPTANGLFSPGGLGSMLNTPRGAMNAPRTPRTPTVSTSFFFSDVASLPRGADAMSPKPGDPARRSGPRGYSNIICISPLASSKGRNGTSTQGNTPMNFKDLFASPNDKGRPRSLPLLGDSPSKGMKSRGSHRATGGDPSLDAVHLAERDLIEDEDLSVLLQLASNTPRSHDRGTAEGHHVFRHPNNKDAGGENHPSLQLPVIGGRDGGDANSSRLARKTHSREHADEDDFAPPPLGIRSSSSGGGNNNSKEIFLGSRGDMKYDHKSGDDDRHSDESTKRKVNVESSHPPLKKRKGAGQGPPPPSHYPMHPYDVPPYYPMPGMPPGGSMRVVVGGPPPPPRGSKKGGSPPRSSNGSPVRPHPYDRPPYPPPYPPHGVYSHHMPPHMGMGVPSYYPPPHHPPPPRHMMYGSHPPQPLSKSKNNSKKNAKKANNAKSMPPVKKPVGAPAATPPPPPPPPPPPVTSSMSSSTLQQRTSPISKSKKKSPSKTSSSSKKKNRSPPIEDPADREKAAATIAAVNAASGGKNDKAAALAAAILRGVTMRPSGKWQAQLYYAGKSRYIGVFDTREKAALAYEIAREKLKADKTSPAEQSAQSQDTTEAAVNAARKAAFEGVNERDRIPTK